ncbi:hypothetical protein HBH92_233730 [Parastagonospora nodorum]|nr:hypothetical protein HBH46_078240 [Parastagonospora nodorum]KAH4164184.1 hypothetical protein HBH43_151950 [Parastagonospora nodorum]KAH4400440.1 hypothetical protein HBH92_233730 [Parastagonospora nodorum]KAH4436663.1 hypothetical protein HBH93_111870 [Parastagonospora nodorum]KAH4438694.1 hypothetical protein HBH91_184090 [Parastagonospora nodorum]
MPWDMSVSGHAVSTRLISSCPQPPLLAAFARQQTLHSLTKSSFALPLGRLQSLRAGIELHGVVSIERFPTYSARAVHATTLRRYDATTLRHPARTASVATDPIDASGPKAE